MQVKKYSPIKLGVFLAVLALLVKIYQHNRLVYLTYTHQRLAREHAELVQECMQLRGQHHRVASYHAIARTQLAKKMRRMRLNHLVELGAVLTQENR